MSFAVGDYVSNVFSPNEIWQVTDTAPGASWPIFVTFCGRLSGSPAYVHAQGEAYWAKATCYKPVNAMMVLALASQ